MPAAFQKTLGTLLELFFNLLYHQFAWSYDFVANTVSLGLWYDWVKTIVPGLQGPTILELGHGSGHLQLALAKSGQPIFGLDASQQMGRLAKRKLTRHKHPIRLTNGLAQQLPFSQNSFTQVVATFPTEYVTAPETLAEIYRVLKSNGHLTIIPVAWITGDGLLQRAAALLFKITGQAADLNTEQIKAIATRFENAGFITTTEMRQLPTSRLLIIQATKPG